MPELQFSHRCIPFRSVQVQFMTAKKSCSNYIPADWTVAKTLNQLRATIAAADSDDRDDFPSTALFLPLMYLSY